MSDEFPVVMNILYGTVELPRPIGKWRRDPDGGWWEEHTPTRWLNRDGSIEREEPYRPYVRMFGFDPTTMRPERQPRSWWQFWKAA